MGDDIKLTMDTSDIHRAMQTVRSEIAKLQVSAQESTFAKGTAYSKLTAGDGDAFQGVQKTKKELKNLDKILSERSKITTYKDLGTDLKGISKYDFKNVKSLNNFLKDIDSSKVKKLNTEVKAITESFKKTGLLTTQQEESLRKYATEQAGFWGKVKAGLFTVNGKMQGIGETLGVLATKIAFWTIMTTAIFGTIRAMKELVESIKEIDTASVQLEKSLAAAIPNQEELNKAMSDTITVSKKLGREVGVEFDKILIMQRDFIRQGRSIEEAQQLTRTALLATNIGFLKQDEAIRFVTSAIQQFNLDVSDSVRVLDAWNNIDNKVGASVKGLAEAVSRAGAAFKIVGGDIAQLNALAVAAIRSTGQSGEVIGTSLRTLSVRYADVNKRMSAANVLMKETGINIVSNDGRFRGITETLGLLAGKWGELAPVQQASIAKAIAGQRHFSRLVSIMNNWDIVIDGLVEGINSLDSATAENNRFMQSYAKQLEVNQALTKELADNFKKILLPTMKSLTVIGRGILEFLISFTDNIEVATASVGFLTTALLVMTGHPVLAWITAVTVAVGFAAKAMDSLNNQVKKQETLFSSYKNEIDDIHDAFQELSDQFIIFRNSSKSSDRAISSLAKSLSNGNKEVEKNIKTSLKQALTIDDQKKSYEEYIKVLTKLKNKKIDEKIQTLSSEKEYSKLKDEHKSLINTIETLELAIKALTDVKNKDIVETISLKKYTYDYGKALTKLSKVKQELNNNASTKAIELLKKEKERVLDQLEAMIFSTKVLNDYNRLLELTNKTKLNYLSTLDKLTLITNQYSTALSLNDKQLKQQDNNLKIQNLTIKENLKIFNNANKLYKESEQILDKNLKKRAELEKQGITNESDNDDYENVVDNINKANKLMGEQKGILISTSGNIKTLVSGYKDLVLESEKFEKATTEGLRTAIADIAKGGTAANAFKQLGETLRNQVADDFAKGITDALDPTKQRRLTELGEKLGVDLSAYLDVDDITAGQALLTKSNDNLKKSIDALNASIKGVIKPTDTGMEFGPFQEGYGEEFFPGAFDTGMEFGPKSPDQLKKLGQTLGQGLVGGAIANTAIQSFIGQGGVKETEMAGKASSLGGIAGAFLNSTNPLLGALIGGGLGSLLGGAAGAGEDRKQKKRLKEAKRAVDEYNSALNVQSPLMDETNEKMAKLTEIIQKMSKAGEDTSSFVSELQKLSSPFQRYSDELSLLQHQVNMTADANLSNKKYLDGLIDLQRRFQNSLDIQTKRWLEETIFNIQQDITIDATVRSDEDIEMLTDSIVKKLSLTNSVKNVSYVTT